jgi:cytochrome c-type biogenesis protein CcmH/NrfG
MRPEPRTAWHRDQSPEIDANWITLAKVALRSGHHAAALAALARSIELNPANRSSGKF